MESERAGINIRSFLPSFFPHSAAGLIRAAWARGGPRYSHTEPLHTENLVGGHTWVSDCPGPGYVQSQRAVGGTEYPKQGPTRCRSGGCPGEGGSGTGRTRKGVPGIGTTSAQQGWGLGSGGHMGEGGGMRSTKEETEVDEPDSKGFVRSGFPRRTVSP